MINIDIVNQTPEASEQTIKWLTAALQKQVSRDFAPVWGVDAKLHFVPKNHQPNPDHWQLVFLTDADEAGALGYHDVTANGLPLGKVFVRTTELAGDAWSVTASHELLEMLIDPQVNLTVFMQTSTTHGMLYAYEVCDACEADDLGYVINNFKMSDFVYPAWFESQPASNSQFDFMKHLSGSFQLAEGGYIGMYEVPNKHGWVQLLARGAMTHDAPAGTRRALRNKPLPTRQKSYKHIKHGKEHGL